MYACAGRSFVAIREDIWHSSRLHELGTHGCAVEALGEAARGDGARSALEMQQAGAPCAVAW